MNIKLKKNCRHVFRKCSKVESRMNFCRCTFKESGYVIYMKINWYNKVSLNFRHLTECIVRKVQQIHTYLYILTIEPKNIFFPNFLILYTILWLYMLCMRRRQLRETISCFFGYMFSRNNIMDPIWFCVYVQCVYLLDGISPRKYVVCTMFDFFAVVYISLSFVLCCCCCCLYDAGESLVLLSVCLTWLFF